MVFLDVHVNILLLSSHPILSQCLKSVCCSNLISLHDSQEKRNEIPFGSQSHQLRKEGKRKVAIQEKSLEKKQILLQVFLHFDCIPFPSPVSSSFFPSNTTTVSLLVKRRFTRRGRNVYLSFLYVASSPGS